MSVRKVFGLAVTLCLVYIHAVESMSCDDIRRIVDGHNNKRFQVASNNVPGQPAAAQMNGVVWDKELAAKASQWAAKDIYSHNPDQTIPSKRFRTGENLFQMWTTDPSHKFDVNDAVDSWFDEYKNYTYGVLSEKDFERPPGSQIGHYTQMVWADTMYIGCDVLKTQKQNKYYSYVVCNYGPGGNVIGQYPYKAGQPSKTLTCTGNNCKQRYGNC